MLHASYVRNRATTKRYAEYTKQQRRAKSTECVFCALVRQPNIPQVIAVHQHCLVITNDFAYDFWDHAGVSDHLMVIPKRHVAALGDLTPEERLDYLSVATDYETHGYSMYARAPGNSGKSVVHQHTHLIKTDNKPKKFLLYIKKPLVRVVK